MQTSYTITIITIAAAVMVLMFKICFASKCGKISLCFGAINIEREVEFESREFHNGQIPTPNLVKHIENVVDIEVERGEKL